MKNELLSGKTIQEAVPNGMVADNHRTSGRQYWVDNIFVFPSSQENPHSFSVIKILSNLIHLYRMSNSIIYILIFNTGMIISALSRSYLLGGSYKTGANI